MDAEMVDDKVVGLLGCFGFQSCFGLQSSVEAGLVSMKDWDGSSNWDCRCYQTWYCRTSRLLVQEIGLGRPGKWDSLKWDAWD